MWVKCFALAGLCLLLTGCPTLVSPGATEIHASGTWEHAGSGLSFPEEVAGYRRVAISRYDANGADVAVGYNYESFPALLAFTVYVRPPVTLESGAAASLAEQFELEQKVIREYREGVQVSSVREESFSTDVGSLPVHVAEFRYAEAFAFRTQPVVSQLYLFDRGGWFVKYRLTFAASQERAARAVADRMLREAPWGRRPVPPS